jgi:exopolysaccharide biosynthesis polyprenyl glycosylphosphotransferase
MNVVEQTAELLAAGGRRAHARTTRERVTLRRWLEFALVLDALMLLAAALLEQLALRMTGSQPVPVVWLLALPAATIVLLSVRGLYRSRLRLELVDDLRLIVGATSVVAMAIVTARVLTGGEADVAFEVVHQWLFSVVYLTAGRVGLSFALSRLRRTRAVAIPTVIVGAGSIGRMLARRLQERPELGFEPVAYLDTHPLPPGTPADDLPVIDHWDADLVLGDHEIGQVLLTESMAPSAVGVDIVRDCHRAGVPVALVPRLFEAVPADVEVEHIGALPLVSLRQSNPRSWRFTLKYALDRVVVVAGLLVLAPVLLAAGGAVLLSLGRPILFRQVRVGVDGRRFEMLKFRTMRDGGVSDEQIELPDDVAPGGIEGDDDRRTRVGAFLRRTSIDELPQLFNVLLGDMSIVGPRPERPEFVRRFEQSVDRYGERHRVKAGITGWAQIAGLRGNTSVRDRVEWDNWYIENWTPWLDIKIVLQTFAAVVRAHGTQ